MAGDHLHQGHRQRLRNRFLQAGLEHFEQHIILELLLFYAIPQKDTNEIAHQLLKRFGTISDVLNAPLSELESVEGVGRHSARLISSVHQICEIYRRDKTLRRKVVGLESMTQYAVNCCAGQSENELLLICADNSFTMLNSHVLALSLQDGQPIDIRRMMRIVLGSNATIVMAAVRRPTGGRKPGKEDRRLAGTMAAALKTINVRLVEYLIVRDEKNTVCLSSIPECQLLLRGVL